MGERVNNKKLRKTKKTSNELRQLSAEDHFMEAELALYADDLPRARAAFQKSLEIEPNNVEFLDAYGGFLAECGPSEEALSVLRRACQLQPSAGFEKYMYLGQVLDAEGRGAEAEAAMRQGVAILRADLAALEAAMQRGGPADEGDDDRDGAAQEDLAHLQQALCSALCSLAEQLMAAVAAAADAEGEDAAAAAATAAASPSLAECELLLGEAGALGVSSPEPLQALCSLRRVQGRDDDALCALRQSMALWFRLDEDSEEEGEEREDGGHVGRRGDDPREWAPTGALSAPCALPSFEFRFEAAKLLLELDDTTEAAVAVLEGLIEENDGVPEVWLLLAVAHRAGGDIDAAVAAAKEGCALVEKLGLPAQGEVAATLAQLAKEVDPPCDDGDDDDGGEEGGADDQQHMP